MKTQRDRNKFSDDYNEHRGYVVALLAELKDIRAKEQELSDLLYEASEHLKKIEAPHSDSELVNMQDRRTKIRGVGE